MCVGRYPGTREGVILVSVTPRSVSVQRANGAGREVDGEARRRELADFLRTRRAALQPSDVGLPNGGRRRTPGLRREEVAQLAGVGTTWYTWLEQGRDVRASKSVLGALADALRLTRAERTHLFRLGRGEPPPPPAVADEKASPTIRRLIANLGAPAYLLGRRWDFLAWNDAMAAVFGDPGELAPEWRNHMWVLFTDPSRRELMPDWTKGARMAVARFRGDHARHVGDPAFERLIGALQEASPEFREWWSRHEVAPSAEGRKVLNHPEAGRLVFEHAPFHRADQWEQRLIVYSPVDEDDTPAKLERLLERKRR
jgi:transcriptional regulator with XRE-family HTH domain